MIWRNGLAKSSAIPCPGALVLATELGAARRAGAKHILTKTGLETLSNVICVALPPINSLVFSRKPGSGTLLETTGEPRHVRRHS